MKKIEQSSQRNRGRKTNRARSEIAKKVPSEGKKREKKPSKWFPIIMIIILLAAVIILGLALDWTNCDNGSSLTNNINDTSENWEKYKAKSIELSGTGKTLITDPGVYTLTGELTDGYVEITSIGAVKLILDNVSITNNSGPAIYVAEAKLVVIETSEDSTNTLIDGSVYYDWDEDVCGTIFSHDDFVLQGAGLLKVQANYEDGIVGKDDLKINSGSYVIDAKDEGIRGRDSVYIVDGTFEIISGGDAIKSNNSEEVSKGWIKIDGGVITINAGDDGVHAESSLEINGGIVQISKSYEGLEGAKITINGGDVSIVASDDGINAAGGNDGSSPNMSRYQQSSNAYAISINGGSLYVNSTGDGIDSNGAFYVNGGTVIVDGPTNSGNGALDAETGVVYNGGSIVAVGASGMAVAPVPASEKNSISIFFGSTYGAGTTIKVTDANGEIVLRHSSAKSFQHASLSSDAFEDGKTYSIYINNDFYTAVTLSEKTTQVGSGRMEPGGRMGPGNKR